MGMSSCLYFAYTALHTNAKSYIVSRTDDLPFRTLSDKCLGRADMPHIAPFIQKCIYCMPPGSPQASNNFVGLGWAGVWRMFPNQQSTNRCNFPSIPSIPWIYLGNSFPCLFLLHPFVKMVSFSTRGLSAGSLSKSMKILAFSRFSVRIASRQGLRQKGAGGGGGVVRRG